MIKQIIFDLDGVLIDSSHLHKMAFSEAFEKISGIAIPKKLNLEALSSKQKLEILKNLNLINVCQFNEIKNLKNKITEENLHQVKISKCHQDMISKLSKEGYCIQIVSNCIDETVKYFVDKFNLKVNFYHGSSLIKCPKPNCETYIKSFCNSGFGPKETLIVEDSIVGLEAAHKSGANILKINKPDDLNYELIKSKMKAPPFVSHKTNIIIPIAGKGSRFNQSRFKNIKPLIEIKNRFMLDIAIKSLNINANYIFIAREEDVKNYPLKTILNLICPKSKLIISKKETQGTACTTLLAQYLVDNEEELMIVNSDQYIEWDSELFFEEARKGWDGVTVTFKDKDKNPKWSFTKKDEFNNVLEVAEKNPISDMANVGIYWWKKGKDYIKYANQMISKNIKTNNEFYVAPIYNEAIKDGLNISTFEVSEMYGLGTPEDLEIFENEKSNVSFWSST